MSASKDFADQLAASVPTSQRAELDAAEQARTITWLTVLAEASGHGPDNPFTGRQLAAARRLVEGAAIDTLRTVAQLLKALSDD